MAVFVFVAICVVGIGATAFSIIRSRHHTLVLTGGVAYQPVPAQGLNSGSYLLFESTALNRDYGRVGLVPLDDPSAVPAISPLTCARVAYASGRGLCLTKPATGVVSTTKAIVFGPHFNTLFTVPLTGFPSRAQVSPNGEYGAVTNFVAGDSYATMGQFSTRTDIIDLRTGTLLFDLAKLQVTRNGSPFTEVDFNFWGVTFAKDNQHFYATLGTGGQTYLIEGDVATEQATVMLSGIECPSLSPDNSQIAFKKRQPGTIVTWRLWVLDLATMTEHPLAETASIDDQAQWLNNSTVIYGLPVDPAAVAALGASNPGLDVMAAGASILTDTWSVPANGTGTPTLLTAGTWSDQVVTTG
ncbi:MAG TPA: hypothetical protein VKY26_02765 [Actinomycetota bacterium]|nr:hypothetical protein [Actinomycetota bacterium]